MWSWSWILREAAVCSLLCEDGVQAGPNAGPTCQRLGRIMQARIMNNRFLYMDFPWSFVDFPQHCAAVFTHRWICLLCLYMPREGHLRSECCEGIGSMTCLHQILLTSGAIEVGTRDVHLPVATLRSAFGICRKGLSSLCAQTLGH